MQRVYRMVGYKPFTFVSSCSISNAIVSKTCPELPTMELSELKNTTCQHLTVMTTVTILLTSILYWPFTISFVITNVWYIWY